MNVLAWLMILLIIVPVSAMVWSFIAVDRSGMAAVQSNLGRGVYPATTGSPKTTRNPTVVASRMAGLRDLSVRLAPKGYAGWLDKLLAKAGRPEGMPLERLLIVKPALALAAAFMSILVGTQSPTGILLLFMILLPVLAYFAPDVFIHGRGAERQKVIEMELPNTLDQLLIAVEAGLGFEAAMARSARNGTGPLAAELIRASQDLQVGRSRKEAYLAMAERAGVPDLRNFVRAVVQADSYGISLTGVLRTQAKQMRIRRRQRAEEKAMKLPVKVLFPLMVCILPVLFIVVLGPAIISIMDTLG